MSNDYNIDYPYYNPLKLIQLCANKIIKEIYSDNKQIFIDRLNKFNLISDINNVIIERYELIKHIKYNS